MSVKDLIKENREKCLIFNKEYDRVLTDIICYIRINTAESIETEEVISDLIDIFLDEQRKDTPVNKVINGDYREYCKEIINTLNNGKGSRMFGRKNLSYTLAIALLMLLVINIPTYIGLSIKSKELVPFSVKLDLLIQIMSVPMVSLFIVKYLSSNLLFTKNKKDSIKHYIILSIAMILLTLIPVVMHLLKWDIVLFNINILAIFALILVLSSYVVLKLKQVN